MFEVGTLVMHETAGVCRVNGTVELDRMAGEYYELAPLYSKGSTLYSPMNSQKIKLRPVMSHDEADKLIDRFAEVEPLVFASQMEQKQLSADILKSGDSMRLAQLAKTIYASQLRRSRAGKKSASSDRDTVKKVEKILFGELAVSLNIAIDQVADYIASRIDTAAAVTS